MPYDTNPRRHEVGSPTGHMWTSTHKPVPDVDLFEVIKTTKKSSGDMRESYTTTTEEHLGVFSSEVAALRYLLKLHPEITVRRVEIKE